ncbi:hypothetical protein [Rhodoferax sp.]|uniref:hypothetical protein n=1 Tax=Rhodoferax sp. TaxID=50421 RepID=UPI00260C2DB9|nr:hypothetical protein [Rhodoferax sp.]MDD2924679.1 hypothetical protein [Rhodoferax sp.]
MKYVKTELGQQAFKARSALLSSRQRAAFILFDGIKSHEQVLAATAGMGITAEDIAYLLREGLIAEVPGARASSASSDPVVNEAQPTTPPAPEPDKTPQQRYAAAMPLATKVTASLGLRGFRLNLAVEAASGYDDLLALLPRIQEAAGEKTCVDLERALKY